ncbi:MAG: translational GTPase TypA [Chromatiales bacterium]|nr:translational GTPase TypA [Chromatiales bacterium]
MLDRLRNIAIVAHVDHGKTTLIDRLLQQSGTLGERFGPVERVMDSNALERERGITILAKNTAIRWGDWRINIVDTPGHADFGGEVERVLSMVDSVLLLVDAVDGPMPQTRFVTQKAFSYGLRPIVVVNKLDREGARPHWALDQTFDLFDRLGASEAQLDFPVVYCSALQGRAGLTPDSLGDDLSALVDTIVAHCPPPDVQVDGPFQLQVSALGWSSYVGALGIGRIRRGRIRRNSPVVVVRRDGSRYEGRVLQVLGFQGLDRVEVDEAVAGDIIAFTGLERPRIADTLCSPQAVEALPPIAVDEPTIQMRFESNTSPFSGREGRFVTSRQLRDRLETETIHNVALRVTPTDDPDCFLVAGRGELHLSILLETMRREGYEMAVSRPEVVVRERDGALEEPYESLVVDVESDSQGGVMEALGERGGELLDMVPDGHGRVRMDYRIPARGLIGFQSLFRTLTAGSGLMHHVFEAFGPLRPGRIAPRANGAMISNSTGKVLGYALFNLQERGRLFVAPGEPVYEGQIVGIHARNNDLTVNPTRAKQLTNIRAAGKDDNILLSPPVVFSLEQALEWIEDDELVEITPAAIRLRKRHLLESDRRRHSRAIAG